MNQNSCDAIKYGSNMPAETHFVNHHGESSIFNILLIYSNLIGNWFSIQNINLIKNWRLYHCGHCFPIRRALIFVFSFEIVLQNQIDILKKRLKLMKRKRNRNGMNMVPSHQISLSTKHLCKNSNN